MLLNALSHYLQNQPLTTDSGRAEAAPAAQAIAETSSDSEVTASFQLSDRAILISAVANEFDVTALNTQDLGLMQNRLLEYGLLDPKMLGAMRYLHQTDPTPGLDAKLPNEGSATMTEASDFMQSDVNALTIMDNLRQSVTEQGGSFSTRQQINHLHTLMSNLASARLN